MAGETEQSAMNSVPGAMTAVAQSSNATLLNSTTTLDGKVHTDSPVLSTEDGSSDHTHEHEKTGLEGESAEVGEGSGILTGARLYLCFSAFMLAVFVRSANHTPVLSYADLGGQMFALGMFCGSG
jgi:hypothetical protein